MPPNVLLLGIQGSGKGTQAKRIASEYDSPHVATGDILRKAIEDGTPLGKQVEDILARGELVPDATMIDLIRERLTDRKASSSTAFPARWRRPRRSTTCSPRSTARSTSSSCSRCQTTSPASGSRSALSKRAAPTTRRPRSTRRIATYHRETEPIVEHYRTRGHLVGIRGTGTVEEVFRQIQDALEQVAVRQ